MGVPVPPLRPLLDRTTVLDADLAEQTHVTVRHARHLLALVPPSPFTGAVYAPKGLAAFQVRKHDADASDALPLGVGAAALQGQRQHIPGSTVESPNVERLFAFGLLESRHPAYFGLFLAIAAVGIGLGGLVDVHRYDGVGATTVRSGPCAAGHFLGEKNQHRFDRFDVHHSS